MTKISEDGKELKKRIKSYLPRERQEWVGCLLSLIEKAGTIAELKEIWDHDIFKGLSAHAPKYPRLTIRLSQNEFQELEELALNGLHLDKSLAGGRKQDDTLLTPLEKLLFAFIWKQGDLPKLRLLVAGMKEKPIKKTERIVLYEFGKYLLNMNSFILDQHTLRCIAVGAAKGDALIQAALKINEITERRSKKYIDAYKIFFSLLEQKFIEDTLEKKNFLYEVDRLLFAAGSLIKVTPSEARKRLVSQGSPPEI